VSVKIGGIEFDNVSYYAKGDVLYVGVTGQGNAVDWGESAEGDGLSYAADGSLVGMTILNARTRLERDGKLVITLPEQQVEATDLGDVLATA
jgi:uncharacterized protein YuzE